MDKRLMPFALAAAAALALVACGKEESKQAETPKAAAEPPSIIVNIGHVAPLTGGIAHLGKDNENGARLAVEEINAKGLTIGGQKITLELDAQDDAADPRTATQVAQKLVDDKVVGV